MKPFSSPIAAAFILGILVAGCASTSGMLGSQNDSTIAVPDVAKADVSASSTPRTSNEKEWIPDAEIERLRDETAKKAKEYRKLGKFDEEAQVFWESAIQNPEACKALLVNYYSRKRSTKPEREPSTYAKRYLQKLADAIYPKEEAVEPTFPRFAFVADEGTIQKLLQEKWESRKKKEIDRAIELAGWRYRIADGVYARKVDVAGGEFPLITLEDAQKFPGTINTDKGGGWKLCLLDKTSSGIRADVVDDPYLELCKQEFRLMSELCQHLGAKRIQCFDRDYTHIIREQDGSASLKFVGGDGAGFALDVGAKYKNRYEQYKDFLMEMTAEWKGLETIRRDRKGYSAELIKRLDNDREFKRMEDSRKTDNQLTKNTWDCSIQNSGNQSLYVQIQAGCNILGIKFGTFFSAEWKETESWEKNRRWGLCVEFPVSNVVD